MMNREQIEKIDKRKGTTLAASTTAIQADNEYAAKTNCLKCGRRGVTLVEHYEPTYIKTSTDKQKLLTVDYRPKLKCPECKTEQKFLEKQ